VDVGDDRDLRLLRDGRQRVGVVLARHGHPDDLAPRGRQLGDLLQRRVDVGRGSRRHRLHRHRRVAADQDTAHVDLAGLVPLGERARRGLGHPEADSHSSDAPVRGGSG
jgi:hypothetical protein